MLSRSPIFAIVAVRTVATDLVVFAGVGIEDTVAPGSLAASGGRTTFSWKRWLRLPFEQGRRRRTY